MLDSTKVVLGETCVGPPFDWVAFSRLSPAAAKDNFVICSEALDV